MAAKNSSDRRALIAQMQKEQASKERRRNFIWAGVIGVIVVVLVVAVIIGTGGSKQAQTTQSHDEIIPAAVTGPPVTQAPPATVNNPSGIDGVVAYDTAGYPASGSAGAGTLTHNHVPGPVTYAVTPPVGGDHNGVWMNAGVYVRPVPTERAVHLLEHGAIWITYNPSLPADQIKALQDFVTKQSMIDEQDGNANRYILLSPWATDALPSPIVLSSWGYQLKVTSPSDARLQKFVDTFRNSRTYSPEYGAAVDGIPVQTGGVPAMDGSKNDNPAGAVNGQGM